MNDKVATITNGPANVYEIVERQEKQFTSVLSTSEISWNKECQFAVQALQANDFLNKTAWKNQPSLQNAIINVASIGVSLNPALKHAYLVPRKNMVCLDISFMGLMHIAQKSGAILWGQSKLVYKNDSYTNTGIDTAPIHEQQTFGDKGDIIGVYCTVKLPSGEYLTEEMDIETLNKIKAAASATNGPWKTWPEEMMRKSVVKRASKYWPQTERTSHAVDMLHNQEGNDAPIVSAPDTGTYSAEQKTYLDQLIEKGDALGMHVFANSFDITDASSASAGVWIGLTRSFERGQKGKYGTIINELRDKGQGIFADYLSEIEANLGGDNDAVRELLSELEIDAINLIESKLPTEMVMEFNKIK